MYGNIMVKKKILEIKLGFWDMIACCKPRFWNSILYYRARIIHSTDVTYRFKRIWDMKKCLWQYDRWHWVWWGLFVFYVFIMNILIVSPPFFFFFFFFLLLRSSSWCLNTKRYPFSGHFYRSLEAPRLSNFLDVDLQLKMIIHSRMKDVPIQWVRLAKSLPRLKRGVGQRMYNPGLDRYWSWKLAIER